MTGAAEDPFAAAAEETLAATALAGTELAKEALKSVGKAVGDGGKSLVVVLTASVLDELAAAAGAAAGAAPAPEKQRTAAAAVAEYLVTELLELGGNAARDHWGGGANSYYSSRTYDELPEAAERDDPFCWCGQLVPPAELAAVGAARVSLWRLGRGATLCWRAAQTSNTLPGTVRP